MKHTIIFLAILALPSFNVSARSKKDVRDSAHSGFDELNAATEKSHQSRSTCEFKYQTKKLDTVCEAIGLCQKDNIVHTELYVCHFNQNNECPSSSDCIKKGMFVSKGSKEVSISRKSGKKSRKPANQPNPSSQNKCTKRKIVPIVKNEDGLVIQCGVIADCADKKNQYEFNHICSAKRNGTCPSVRDCVLINSPPPEATSSEEQPSSRPANTTQQALNNQATNSQNHIKEVRKCHELKKEGITCDYWKKEAVKDRARSAWGGLESELGRWRGSGSTK